MVLSGMKSRSSHVMLMSLLKQLPCPFQPALPQDRSSLARTSSSAVCSWSSSISRGLLGFTGSLSPEP